MKQFYNWQPGADDDEGRAIKNTFMANMVQTGFDSQMAKDLAYHNAHISGQQMQQAADLEMRNKLGLMNDEFNKGMIKMGKEYDYQSRFATDEANRRLNEMSHSGDITQRQTQVQGQVDVAKIAAQGDAEKKVVDAQSAGQVANTKVQGQVDLANLAAQGANKRAEIQEQGKVDTQNIVKQGEVDISKIGAAGEQERLGMKTQGAIDISKIQETGSEERKTMGEANRLEAKTRANQSQYARGLAGKF